MPVKVHVEVPRGFAPVGYVSPLVMDTTPLVVTSQLELEKQSASLVSIASMVFVTRVKLEDFNLMRDSLYVILFVPKDISVLLGP